MDKNTLSNYGWIVVLILVLSVLLALATPFGTYIGNATKFTPPTSSPISQLPSPYYTVCQLSQRTWKPLDSPFAFLTLPSPKPFSCLGIRFSSLLPGGLLLILHISAPLL